VVKNCNEREKLEKAVLWIGKALEIEEKSNSNKIYSRLLFILGNKTEAIKLMNRILSLAKQEKADSSRIEFLVNASAIMKR